MRAFIFLFTTAMMTFAQEQQEIRITDLQQCAREIMEMKAEMLDALNRVERLQERLWLSDRLKISQEVAVPDTPARPRGTTSKEMAYRKTRFIESAITCTQAISSLVDIREYKEPHIHGPSPEAPEPHPRREVNQFLMVPHLRHLRSDIAMHDWAKKSKSAGFSGMHTVVETAWWSDEVRRISGLPRKPKLHAWALERLEVLVDVCAAHGLALHLWIWGDIENDVHPAARWGKRSTQEREVYAWIRSKFADKHHVTWGIGFDIEEWMDPDYAQWIISQLPGIRLSMRHPIGAFDTVATIPSRMHRRPTEDDFRAFRKLWPHGRMIMSEDRFRNQPYEPTNSGHIPLDYQASIWRWAEEHGISCIWGHFPVAQHRYELGSDCYPDGWRGVP